MQDLADNDGIRQIATWKIKHEGVDEEMDWVAIEEPLEMKLRFGPAEKRQQQTLAITMRTPGQDHDLLAGFLFTEGLIGRFEHLVSMRHVGQALNASAQNNILLAELAPNFPFDPQQISRHFYTSSSCGVCGKTSIELVQTVSCYYPRPVHPKVSAETLSRLPNMLLGEQSLFQHTGGIHAAGLFEATSGRLVLLREDVGRHNALDKLIGAALRQGQIPLRDHILLLSGRISFELVQKAAMAGIPIVGAVGAPSSLAIDMASEHSMTLVGFLRNNRFNVYCGQNRINLQPNKQYEIKMHQQ